MRDEENEGKRGSQEYKNETSWELGVVHFVLFFLLFFCLFSFLYYYYQHYLHRIQEAVQSILLLQFICHVYFDD